MALFSVLGLLASAFGALVLSNAYSQALQVLILPVSAVTGYFVYEFVESNNLLGFEGVWLRQLGSLGVAAATGFISYSVLEKLQGGIALALSVISVIALFVLVSNPEIVAELLEER